MSGVTQLITFKASPDFSSKVGNVKEFLTSQSASSSFVKAVKAGTGVEDPSAGFIFIDWESADAHKKWSAEPDNKFFYDKVKTIIADGEEPRTVHVSYGTEYPASKVLASPVVAVHRFTGKSDSDRATFEQKFKVFFPKLPTEKKACGRVVEDENKFFLLTGWDSVDAHNSALKSDETWATAVEGVTKVMDANTVHVKLI